MARLAFKHKSVPHIYAGQCPQRCGRSFIALAFLPAVACNTPQPAPQQQDLMCTNKSPPRRRRRPHNRPSTLHAGAFAHPSLLHQTGVLQCFPPGFTHDGFGAFAYLFQWGCFRCGLLCLFLLPRRGCSCVHGDALRLALRWQSPRVPSGVVDGTLGMFSVNMFPRAKLATQH